MLPTPDGKPGLVLAGVGSVKPDLGLVGHRGPSCQAAFTGSICPPHPTHAALGWALGDIALSVIGKNRMMCWFRLVWPDGADRASVTATFNGYYFSSRLSQHADLGYGTTRTCFCCRSIGIARYQAQVRHVVGDDLIKQIIRLFMLLDGRRLMAVPEDPRAPRLIDVIWGDEKAPKITSLVRASADTGGLDLSLRPT